MISWCLYNRTVINIGTFTPSSLVIYCQLVYLYIFLNKKFEIVAKLQKKKKCRFSQFIFCKKCKFKNCYFLFVFVFFILFTTLYNETANFKHLEIDFTFYVHRNINTVLVIISRNMDVNACSKFYF